MDKSLASGILLAISGRGLIRYSWKAMMRYNRDAIRMARYYHLAQPVYLDTETTGLHDTAEIVEICVLEHDGAVLLDTLVRPRRKIPWDATQVNGITNEMVQASPAWPEVWPSVEAVLRGRMVGVYNAEFDMRMLKQSHRANGMVWDSTGLSFFCLMKLYAQFSGTNRWQSLEEAGRRSGIPLPNAHRAHADVLLARALLEYMAKALA